MPKTETSPQQRTREMDWPDAQREILNGRKLRRRSWANTDLYMVMTSWGLEHRTESGAMHQLTVCAADLMAEDWIIVRDN